MKSLRLFAALLVMPFPSFAAAPEPLPPLFYVVVVNSQVTNIDSMGLTPGPTGDAGRKSKLMHSIACMGGQCRRIVDPPQAYDRNWFAKLLAQEPTQAGRLAYMYVSFGGYHYDVMADLQEGKLNGAGKMEYGTRLFAHYSGACERSEKPEEIAALRSEPPTTGVLGSFELHSQFLDWSGCNNERLLEELGRSFEQIAEFWQARLTPESEREIVATLANRQKMPLLREVIAEAAAAGDQGYGSFRVVEDRGEYLWLAFPDNQPKIQNSIIIMPRARLACPRCP